MRKFIDKHIHRGLRAKLVVDLRTKGIKDQAILNAFLSIPRHYFLDEAFFQWAYKDTAFPIAVGQTISQPYTVAMQTNLLGVVKGDKILEIGTGSGFQACILSFLGAKVYSIERQKVLFEKTDRRLRQIGFTKIRTLYGDGFKGATKFAPFDKIIITCGATEIPTSLFSQLRDGGVMVVPAGTGDNKKMYKITKQGDDLIKEEHGVYRFVPMLQGVNT